MRCATCEAYIDESRQSPVCPHQGLQSPDHPQGGPRIPSELCALIQEAYQRQDRMALYRYMSHANAAARLYATEMSELLDVLEHPIYGGRLSTPVLDVDNVTDESPAEDD